MTGKIRIGIVGYGNLGRGVELAVNGSDDMELAAIFTRRPVESLGNSGGKIVAADRVQEFAGAIDVMILCLGSAADLPALGPGYAGLFNTVDSYDNHGEASRYYTAMDQASCRGGKTSAVCLGWDPGLFSLTRVLLGAVLPTGVTETFWGPGISLGHSDALKRVAGVKEGVQYTVPSQGAIGKARRGEGPLPPGEKHRRECYVTAEQGAERAAIIAAIKAMPDYFHGYDTSVTFVDEAELSRRKAELAHGGFVLRAGKTGQRNQRAEFTLQLGSNPEFTGGILAAYARAVYRLNRQGETGAKTVLDIPIKLLSARPLKALIEECL